MTNKISWGVTEIGPGHIKNNLPNQDAWLIYNCPEFDLAVVSDGVGSAKKSEIGSKTICSSAIEATNIFFGYPEGRFENYFELIHTLWNLSIAPNSPRDCSATCLLAVKIFNIVLLARLGDGLIAACRKDGNATILADSKEDSFSNVTECLGAVYNPEKWNYKIIDPGEYNAVILCTDGIADDIPQEKYSDFALHISSHYEKSEPTAREIEIKNWLSDWPCPGHSDDKTIVCLYL